MRLRCTVTMICVLALATAAHAVSVEELIDELESGASPPARTSAALRLGTVFDEQKRPYQIVVTALVKQIRNKEAPASLRAECVKSLGKLGVTAAYPLVTALAKDLEEKPVVRAAATKSMLPLGAEQAVPDLIALLKDEKNNTVKRQIISSLSLVDNPALLIAAVAPLLEDKATAKSGVEILGATKDTAAIVPLTELLSSESASVRRAVIKAFGNIEDERVVTPLLKYYLNPGANVAERVQILTVMGKFSHAAVIELARLELKSKETNPALRRQSAVVLGTLKAAEAISTLVGVMLDVEEDRGLRMTCTQALGNFSDHDDEAILGLIAALDDTRLAGTATISLSRMTRRYFRKKERWLEWFEQWRVKREKQNARLRR